MSPRGQMAIFVAAVYHVKMPPTYGSGRARAAAGQVRIAFLGAALTEGADVPRRSGGTLSHTIHAGRGGFFSPAPYLYAAPPLHLLFSCRAIHPHPLGSLASGGLDLASA